MKNVSLNASVMPFYLIPNIDWVNYMDEKEGWRGGISSNMGIDQFLTEMFQAVDIAHLSIVSLIRCL